MVGPDGAPLAVTIGYEVVDLSAWSAWPADPYQDHALKSGPPHGLDCACLMCADLRLDQGLAALETLVGLLGRRFDERAAGVAQLPDGEHA